MLKNADNSTTINVNAIPLESLADISFFNRQNYCLNPISPRTKPSRNRVVLIYNSDYLDPSFDWIAIAMGRKVNFLLSKDGTITTVENAEIYLKQSADTTYYIYGKVK